jgi:hypothetical protein
MYGDKKEEVKMEIKTISNSANLTKKYTVFGVIATC